MPFLFFKKRNNHAVAQLYSSIVKQARHQYFYRVWQVPDTIEGRFDMIVLHLILILNRFEGESNRESEFGQHIFDHFINDMDGNLRELGVNDIRVPKKVKKMAEAFFGRAQAYRDALAKSDDEALFSAIQRNLFPDHEDTDQAVSIGKYAWETIVMLSQQNTVELMSGSVTWLEPMKIDKWR